MSAQDRYVAGVRNRALVVDSYVMVLKPKMKISYLIPILPMIPKQGFLNTIYIRSKWVGMTFLKTYARCRTSLIKGFSGSVEGGQKDGQAGAGSWKIRTSQLLDHIDICFSYLTINATCHEKLVLQMGWYEYYISNPK